MHARNVRQNKHTTKRVSLNEQDHLAPAAPPDREAVSASQNAQLVTVMSSNSISTCFAPGSEGGGLGGVTGGAIDMARYSTAARIHTDVITAASDDQRREGKTHGSRVILLYIQRRKEAFWCEFTPDRKGIFMVFSQVLTAHTTQLTAHSSQLTVRTFWLLGAS